MTSYTFFLVAHLQCYFFLCYFSDVFNLAIDGCKGKFRETEERCKKKLGIASHAFCWPLKLTAICNLAKCECEKWRED